jgi:hypothetical protein
LKTKKFIDFLLKISQNIIKMFDFLQISSKMNKNIEFYVDLATINRLFCLTGNEYNQFSDDYTGSTGKHIRDECQMMRRDKRHDPRANNKNCPGSSAAAPAEQPASGNSGEICSRNKTQITGTFSDKKAICSLFFPPNNAQTRYYFRRTIEPPQELEEFFCFSDGNKSYDKWAQVTLKDINRVFELDPTKNLAYAQFSDNYTSGTGLYLKQNCPAILAGTASAGGSGGGSGGDDPFEKEFTDYCGKEAAFGSTKDEKWQACKACALNKMKEDDKAPQCREFVSKCNTAVNGRTASVPMKDIEEICKTRAEKDKENEARTQKEIAAAMQTCHDKGFDYIFNLGTKRCYQCPEGSLRVMTPYSSDSCKEVSVAHKYTNWKLENGCDPNNPNRSCPYGFKRVLNEMLNTCRCEYEYPAKDIRISDRDANHCFNFGAYNLVCLQKMCQALSDDWTYKTGVINRYCEPPRSKLVKPFKKGWLAGCPEWSVTFNIGNETLCVQGR